MSLAVIGNIVGCAIFASLTVMGHKTGVNQMVLSRAPFGRRGGYLSSWLQFLMTMGWIGVNTYFPVVLAVAILGHFGVGDSFGVKFIVVTVIMIIQVGIGAFLLGLVCGWLFEFGLVGALQGYVSRHLLFGGDLSWLVSIVVAGGVYLLGMRGKVAVIPARELTGAAGQPTA